jgi:hypothetical protein
MAAVDYEVRDPAQHARFVAFVKHIEQDIVSARAHENVVAFLRTLDLDAMRALFKLAREVPANNLGMLIVMVAEEKGWQA